MVSYTPDSISEIILFILAAVVILIAIWSIFSFIRAIFFFIFSQWKEEKIKKAWNSIRYMIIWIILTVALLYLFPLIFKLIGLENYDKYSAKSIFNKAWTILSNVFELKDVIKDSQELNKYNWQLYYDFDNASKTNDYEL